MQSPRRRFVALAAVAPLLAAGLAACSDSEKDKAVATTCPSNMSSTASTGLPADIPAPGSGQPYDYSNQGKTQVWFFALDGTADQLASLRDNYDNTLKGKGYEIEGTDQEAGAEAESEFKGPHEGTTNFRMLCTGKVVLRLKLTS